MKRVFFLTAACLMITVLALAAADTVGIAPRDVAGKPEVFCKVTKEPDPLLMGGRRCVHHRYDKKLQRYFDEPVEYRLLKYGDQYGLYFFRIKAGERTYKGWREAVINGDTITSPTGFKISVRNGEVYYLWDNDQPTRMSRTAGE